jgi:Family of unknown function (DUF6325)
MPGVLRTDQMGPVDVAVITFDRSEPNRDIAPVLADLQANGTVKVIDLAFVRKMADGSTSIMELAEDDISDAFEPIAQNQVDLLSEADLSELAATLAPASSAMVVVWENTWAARFALAVRKSHGHVAMLERIPAENVERAVSALEE